MRARAMEATYAKRTGRAHTRRHPRSDRATSEVIGTLLLALITVTMALAFSDFVVRVVPEPTERGPLDLNVRLEPGLSQWNDGDETVVISHQGGEPLHANGTTINLEIAGDTVRLTGVQLGSAFDDGALSIGETWSYTTTIPASANVLVDVVDHGPPAQLAASAQLRAGAQDCSSDTNPPTVSTWTPSPSNVSGATLGSVTITATATDGCSGTNTSATPHLWYRIEDGTSPSYTDTGAMTKVGTKTWEGTVPEPVAGWSAHGSSTLQYQLRSLEDLSGNSGQSETRADKIEPGEPAPGTLTYATEHQAFAGTLADFPALQNASDGNNETTLTEVEAGSGSTTSEIYGTAHSSSGVTAPGNATGSPDDGHATVPSDNDWLGIRGFNTFSGTIETVELGFEGHYTGSATGTEDALKLAYEVSSTEGPTTRELTLSDLSSGSDGGAVYVNVTSDRSWTWDDISNMLVKASYQKNQQEDAADFFADALWVRVSYDDPAYDMDIQINITGVPAGSDQTLEIEYRVDDEAHDVQVYNHTGGSWETVGARLTETVTTNWTLSLSSDQINGAGDVRMRVLDDGPDATSQTSVHLDFVRVRTR